MDKLGYEQSFRIVRLVKVFTQDNEINLSIVK